MADAIKKKMGRPPGSPNSYDYKHVRDLALANSEEAFAELVRLAHYARGEMVRVFAIERILDRAYGKVAQAVSLSGPDEGAIQIEHKAVKDAELFASGIASLVAGVAQAERAEQTQH